MECLHYQAHFLPNWYLIEGSSETQSCVCIYENMLKMRVLDINELVPCTHGSSGRSISDECRGGISCNRPPVESVQWQWRQTRNGLGKSR